MAWLSRNKATLEEGNPMTSRVGIEEFGAIILDSKREERELRATVEVRGIWIIESGSWGGRGE